MTETFTVSATGAGPRILFYVSENKKGDTFVTFNRGTRFRNAGSPGAPFAVPREEAEYLNSKVSIHPPTDRSQEQLTTLHLTMNQSDGTSFHGYALTDVIKTGNSFAVLFCRRSSDVRSPSYGLKRLLTSYVSIGSYHPTLFELLFVVLVSSPDSPLKLPPIKRSFSLTSKKMTHVRISVLSTLLDLPSTPSGWTFWGQTFRETDRLAAWHTPEELANMKKGHAADQIDAIAEEFFGRLRDESVETQRNITGQDPQWTPSFFALNSTAAAKRERELYEGLRAEARKSLEALGVKFDARGRIVKE